MTTALVRNKQGDLVLSNSPEMMCPYIVVEVLIVHLAEKSRARSRLCHG